MAQSRFCRKCRFDVPEKTFHCSYCDVCIIGYDHHCPWTSKCIGKNNLIKFYVFLFYTPIFIVYCAFAFGFTIDAAERGNNHLRSVGK
jgi:palmitoyltransferase ZDHHC2/15/20